MLPPAETEQPDDPQAARACIAIACLLAAVCIAGGAVVIGRWW